jgi:hypothetical protein
MKFVPLTLVAFLFFTIGSPAQNNVGINDNNSTPDASAVLDVSSSTKGLLIPRIALDTTASALPLTTPAASLLIYNTAAKKDVTPGYYYWNGSSRWVRLTGSADAQHVSNVVVKSADATLLKNENMVFTTGNTKLTLPAITPSDNGLEITIKNIGTVTDLVIVKPPVAKLIDGADSALMTRWRSRTYVAYNSNWYIKDKETRTDNSLEVNPTSSFTTIEEVISFLNVHMYGPTVVKLGAGVFPVSTTQAINLPYPVTFEGLSFGETTIKATSGLSGSPMFTCASECYFKMIIFEGYASTTGNDAIHFTGSEAYHEIKDCDFSGFNKGISSTNNNEIWIFETDFENCTGSGIEVAAGPANGGSLKISECDFNQCGKGVYLLSGVGETISILNCTFYNTTAGSDIGIHYVPATFTSFSSMFITNNAWNNQGTYMSGFDFTRSDGRDANAFLINNSGMEDERPHCKMNVSNNNSTTTITNNGTFYKANWTNSATSYTCKWTLANNKITFQPNNLSDVWAVITGDLAVNNSNRVVTIAIVKNGNTATRYGETDLRITTANQPFQFSTVIYVPDVHKYDYLELYVTSSAGSDVVTFQDIQWFTNTQ